MKIYVDVGVLYVVFASKLRRCSISIKNHFHCFPLVAWPWNVIILFYLPELGGKDGDRERERERKREREREKREKSENDKND